MADKVRTGKDDSTIVDKPGMKLVEDAPLTVKTAKRYVSRGGHKLEGALDDFAIDVTNLRCVDLGASTGGFTDCLLQRKAASVCAIDVGYGQLAHALQVDPRVDVHDRTNIRTADAAELGAPFDLVVADLSFVGIATVANDIARYVDSDGICLLLIKPQFEARRDEVGERGIVSDTAVHDRVLERVTDALIEAGLFVSAVTTSPIKGATGNTEFWVRCSKNESA
jgi:23S rRNA (cytidine1920-2'-O)/16S rRNA (cytidine1409-2'-O)-methyltransferase